ncbi:MAG: SLC13 family permease [Gammaproteobacteria bacterium]
MELQLTPQMILVLFILGLTIFMFVSEVVRVDVTALVIMVMLGLTELFQPYQHEGAGTPWLAHHFPALAEYAPWLNEMLAPVVPIADLFTGFESNAVISIIAVMIIGAGLDKTGLMTRVAGVILKVGGSTEKRIIPLLSGTVGVISSFMQNVGAAALFLPVVSRISSRTGLPLSRLLMPMGFCAILGGTLTMVGSSPVILLNDLILTSNKTLPEGVAPMRTFDLFSITPIGIAMLAVGILYFVLFGRLVLPAIQAKGTQGGSTMDYFRETYGLDYALQELRVAAASPPVGMNVGDIERRHGVRIVGLQVGREARVGPSKEVVVEAGSTLAVMAPQATVERFARDSGLELRQQLETFAESLIPTRAGISEVVIPPGSRLIGKTVRGIGMRRSYGLAVLALHRVGETITSGVRDLPLQAGDTLICHSAWEDLARLERDRNFVVVTTEFPHEESRPHKVPHALLFFALALCLILFTDLKLSTALLTGAVGMILSGVLNIDEAYQAVSWKTVFLLASLIPLGLAVETTGTAAWIAHQTLNLLHGVPVWVLQAAIAVLATAFTLVMSNVGATVLLVPLAINIAIGAGANPAVFALTVAIATSNSFLIPTHQVNALIMGPGGYRVADFMRAGGIMTGLFLVVMMVMLNLVF